MTTLRSRALRELTRRRARSAFTMLTIAAAVVGLWLFAVPSLIDRAMDERVAGDLLWDIRLAPNGIELTDQDVDALRAVPNVAGIEARVVIWADAREGDRTTDVLLVGVDDFTEQEANVVHLLEGEIPRAGEVLADPQNARSGRFRSGVGDTFTLGGDPIRISGLGASLEWSASVDDRAPTFYLQVDRLQAAIGDPGFSWIDVRVSERTDEALLATADAVRARLEAIDPDITYWEPVQIRDPDSWPEKDQVENVVQLMYVIAALGVASAALMVSTTMNAVVREQTREIGVIKAVGGTRSAILRSYLLTAALLGALGTAVGVAAGIPLANLLVGFAGREFSGVEASFAVPVWILVLSIVVGVGAPVLAALPAIWRAARIPVHDALVDYGVAGSFGRSALDRTVTGLPGLSRSARLGLRNALRNKRRSLVTGLQVGFAVGTFLGFLAMGITILDVSAATFTGEGGDIVVFLREDATDVIAAVPGVEVAAPVTFSSAAINGEVYPLQGQGWSAERFHGGMREGRWFTEDEVVGSRSVAVVGPALASIEGVTVGDSIRVETAETRTDFAIVGITSVMVNDGKMLYLPISTAAGLTGELLPEAYFVATTSEDPDVIDRTASDIGAALSAARIPADVEARHIERDASEAQNRTIIAILLILGIPVIAIGMIGLVNTMVMNVIERRREIGVLRALGARARHIRRMVRSEALAVAFVGWLAAVPLGYAIGSLLVGLLGRTFEVDFALSYPAWPLPVALAGTLVVTAVVVLAPARHAVRLQPGAAIRYE
jgi:putative ABC transport system permease protein